MTVLYQYCTKAPGQEWSEWQDIVPSVYEGYRRDWSGNISPNGYAQVRALTVCGEPVAWRWKWGEAGQWYYGDHGQKPDAEDTRSPYFGKLSAVEPLYLSPTEPKAGVVSDAMVERAMRAFYHDMDQVLRPTDEDDKDDLRRWTADMRAALTAALKGDKP